MDGVRHYRMPEKGDIVHSQRFHSQCKKHVNWSKSPKEQRVIALFQQAQSEPKIIKKVEPATPSRVFAKLDSQIRVSWY